jgi:hypothetical protein
VLELLGVELGDEPSPSLGGGGSPPSSEEQEKMKDIASKRLAANETNLTLFILNSYYLRV